MLSILMGGLILLLLASGAAPETYGTGVTLQDVTPIQRVIERPADFEGRTIRIEGTVTAVCAHMGCWMALAPSSAGPDTKTVRLKVDDGAIVFPVSAKGRRAEAQGVVERVSAGDAEGQEAAGEHARQTGKSAATASAVWQVKATGAIVH